jgi:N-acetyl-anhydromuramyl-L-alanine amidase AmpD
MAKTIRHFEHGFNDREISVEGVLIHSIHAGYYHDGDPHSVDAVIQLLAEYRLGYHWLIDRAGTKIELVPLPLRAWHAGKSVWRGREDCNSWMAGIALIGGQEGEPYTNAQYDALASRTGHIVTRYAVKRENITGHEHVSGDDVRGEGKGKTDPGPEFDWDRFSETIAGFWRP